jgi:hypothetical protein
MSVDESSKLNAGRFKQVMETLGRTKPLNQKTKIVVDFDPNNEEHMEVARILYIERNPVKISKLPFQFKQEGIIPVQVTIYTRIAELTLRKLDKFRY